MSSDESKTFYKLKTFDMYHRDKPRLVNPDFPLLSNLVGLFGEPIYNELYEMAHYFLGQRALFLLVVAGLPGSGKSTFVQEYTEQMRRWGFTLRKNNTYEEAFAIHGDNWLATNNHMYRVTMDEFASFEEEQASGKVPYVPQHMIMEAPVISRYPPGHDKFNFPENRDRAVSYSNQLSFIIEKYPIYFLALTGQRQAQKKAIDYRKQIQDLGKLEGDDAEKRISAFMWAHDLLSPNLTVEPDQLLRLVDSMAMPHHFDQIRADFRELKGNYTKNIVKNKFNYLLGIVEIATGKKVTPREAIVLVEALTYHYYLHLGVGIPEGRILDVINPRRKKLEGIFYRHLAEQQEKEQAQDQEDEEGFSDSEV